MDSMSGDAAQLVNLYEPFLAERYFQVDPFAALVPRTSFMPSNGEIPKVTHLRGEMPTAYPSSLSTLNVTDGPGASGDVTATEVGVGQSDRTYQLVTDAWRSPKLNVSDLTFREQSRETVKNVYDVLKNYTNTRNADWHRWQNLGMCDNKIIALDAGYLHEENSDYDFDEPTLANEGTAQAGAGSTITLASAASSSDDTYNTMIVKVVGGTGAGQYRTISDYVGSTRVATVSAAWDTNPDNTSVYKVVDLSKVPDVSITWDLLNDLYNDLSRRGGDEYKIGMSDGLPTFSFSSGPEIKKDLFQTDIMTEVRYWMPRENFTVRGINKALRGYVPNVDLFPIRYDASLEPIYPFVNTAFTRGTGWSNNPDYKPVSLGGKALYEACTILTREVYEDRPRPSDATSLHRATFTPQNYTGEITWLTPEAIDAVGDNVKRNKGYYRVDWQMAARPLRTYLGYTILAKIPSEVSS